MINNRLHGYRTCNGYSKTKNMARKTHSEVIETFLKNKSAFSVFIIPKGSVTDNQKRITVIALSDKEARGILQKKYPDHEIHIVHVTTLITDYEQTRPITSAGIPMGK